MTIERRAPSAERRAPSAERVKIFVGYHKPYQIIDSKIIQPIHLGRAVALADAKDGANSKKDVAWLRKNMIGDDTGDNISARNRNFCELTGIYWLWKNYAAIGDPARIGFMHYRRHFIFNDQKFREYTPTEKHEKPYAKINVGDIYDGYAAEFGLDDATIRRETAKYDVILPEKCDLSLMDVKSIREDYVKLIPGTKEKDLEILRKVVRRVRPDYADLLNERLARPDKRCFQSFVLRKEIFFDYCEFLFGCLAEVDRRVNTKKYSVNGQRTMGYLGEILFDLYFSRLVRDGKYRVKELGMTFLAANSLATRSVKSRTAIVQLAYSDYESLEISLANYAKYFDDETHFFILQNGRGTYDTERTYRVAKRYENLYPKNITVVDDIPPQAPYLALGQLFRDARLADFDYICKVDDDVFPMSADWFERLTALYQREFSRHGDNLGYVSALVNNNPFGFKQIISRNPEAAREYFAFVARDHRVGVREIDEYYTKGLRFVPAREIDDDVQGTIWQLPYISRWLHEKTTLAPDKYVEMSKNWPVVELRDKRYSINVMMFDKNFWRRIENNDAPWPTDDEFLSEIYCKKHNKYVAVDLANAFAHLFFFTQREENRDLIPRIRQLYEKRLGHPYRISLQPDRALEMADRARFTEKITLAEIDESRREWAHRNMKTRTKIKNSRAFGATWMTLPPAARRKVKKAYRKMRGLEK